MSVSCIISIFLFAAFSTSAQTPQEWVYKAVECERAVFEAGSQDVDSLIMAKVQCLKQAGEFASASENLGRIMMFGLTEEQLHDVLYEKELCSYLSGDFEAAASYMKESGRESLSALDSLVLAENGLLEGMPRVKSEGTATFLSFLPPLGHFYTDNYGEGMLSMALNAGAASFALFNILDGCWVTGILGGAIALNYTFMGNMERTLFLVDKYNYTKRRFFCDSMKKELYLRVKN